MVEEKSRVGDWEGDSIISAGSRSAILSYVDRHSKFTFINMVPGMNLRLELISLLLTLHNAKVTWLRVSVGSKDKRRHM